jgi:release factor glutamine methyltransferase
VTVLEGIQKSAEFLERKGVESPRLHAELVLAYLLKLPRMKLYLNFERVLSVAEVDALRELIRRRGRREPLQHIVGSASFCGLEIAVNRDVLVPRPETELLAEHAWQFLSTSTHQPSTALDFGTGSGCIAIALAVKCSGARVWAVDISPEALVLARQNAASHSVSERIQFLESDGFAALMSEGRVTQAPDSNVETIIGDSRSSSLRNREFDLIVSNPPYIPSAEIASLPPEVRDYDPRRALDGGPDGLESYRRLASEGRPFLKADGRIMLEFGDGQAEAVGEIFQKQNWIVEAIKEDYTQRPRILIAKPE